MEKSKISIFQMKRKGKGKRKIFVYLSCTDIYERKRVRLGPQISRENQPFEYQTLKSPVFR